MTTLRRWARHHSCKKQSLSSEQFSLPGRLTRCLQVKLKKAATKRIKAVLGEAKARSQSEVPQGFQNPEAIGLDLQKQLHTAIQALQKGLVERDTEVGTLQSSNVLRAVMSVLKHAEMHLICTHPAGSPAAAGSTGRRAHSLHWAAWHGQE